MTSETVVVELGRAEAEYFLGVPHSELLEQIDEADWGEINKRLRAALASDSQGGQKLERFTPHCLLPDRMMHDPEGEYVRLADIATPAQPSLSADDQERLELIASRLIAANTQPHRIDLEGDATFLRHFASAPPEVSGEEGHRVEIEFDGFSPSCKLIHPAAGCNPSEGETTGCWLNDWLENEGAELLRGKLTLPVTYKLDGDHPVFYVQPLPPEPPVPGARSGASGRRTSRLTRAPSTAATTWGRSDE